MRSNAYDVDYAIRRGDIANVTQAFTKTNHIDLVITTTRGKSGQKHWMSGGMSSKLMAKLNIPVILVQGEQPAEIVDPFEKILVALDGSIVSECALPYASFLAQTFGSEITLISVPEVPEVENYRAAADVVEDLRREAEFKMQNFLDAVARSLRADGIKVNTLVRGSRSAHTIVETREEEGYDLLIVTSKGRSGFELTMIGSVAERIVEYSEGSVCIVPVLNGVDKS